MPVRNPSQNLAPCRQNLLAVRQRVWVLGWKPVDLRRQDFSPEPEQLSTPHAIRVLPASPGFGHQRDTIPDRQGAAALCSRQAVLQHPRYVTIAAARAWREIKLQPIRGDRGQGTEVFFPQPSQTAASIETALRNGLRAADHGPLPPGHARQHPAESQRTFPPQSFGGARRDTTATVRTG